MKKIHRTILGIAILICSVAPTLAETQLQINGEERAAFEQENRDMNATYKKLFDKITPAGRIYLIDGQNFWMKFMEKECTFESLGSVGGSIHGMVINECKTRLTKIRKEELEHQLNCAEGDTSCGNQ